jgi:hypothetical protein
MNISFIKKLFSRSRKSSSSEESLEKIIEFTEDFFTFSVVIEEVLLENINKKEEYNLKYLFEITFKKKFELPVKIFGEDSFAMLITSLKNSIIALEYLEKGITENKITPEIKEFLVNIVKNLLGLIIKRNTFHRKEILNNRMLSTKEIVDLYMSYFKKTANIFKIVCVYHKQ